jgi:hypothetical protein
VSNLSLIFFTISPYKFLATIRTYSIKQALSKPSQPLKKYIYLSHDLSFKSSAYQKQDVIDGEALEKVGKAGLQLHVLLVEHPHAQDVS